MWVVSHVSRTYQRLLGMIFEEMSLGLVWDCPPRGDINLFRTQISYHGDFIFASFIMNPLEKAWSILSESARQLVQEDYQVFSEAETNAIDTSSIESQEQLGTIPASRHDSMAAQCTEVTSPFILKDLDGDIILAYYPNRIPQNLAETATKHMLPGHLSLSSSTSQLSFIWTIKTLNKV